MSTSYLVQRALADALKGLMSTTPINKIRIQDITDACRITRHTFYNHFQDIYDLLGWIYRNEIIEGMDTYCHLEFWKEGILKVLDYTLVNKTLCLNTYRSLGREHLEDFLYGVFSHFLLGVMEDISETIPVKKSLKMEAADFYANALVGLFMAWLRNGLKERPEAFADRIEKMLEGNLISLFKRYKIR